MCHGSSTEQKFNGEQNPVVISQFGLSKLRSIAQNFMEIENSMKVSNSTQVPSTSNQVTQPSVMNILEQKTNPTRTESQNDVQEIKKMLMNNSTKMNSIITQLTQLMDDKNMIPCKYWKQYKCTRGKRCRYLH